MPGAYIPSYTKGTADPAIQNCRKDARDPLRPQEAISGSLTFGVCQELGLLVFLEHFSMVVIGGHGAGSKALLHALLLTSRPLRAVPSKLLTQPTLNRRESIDLTG